MYFQPSPNSSVIYKNRTEKMRVIDKPQLIISTSLLILLAIIFLILTMTGCINDRINGNNDVIVQNRPSQPFYEVVSEENFYVKIIPSAEARIDVKGESNIIPHLSTIVKGNTLNLKFNNGISINEHYPVEVYLYTPAISSVKLPGSGMIDFDSFNTNAMYLNISGSGNIIGNFITNKIEAVLSGSGNIELSGTSSTATYYVSGSGNIAARNLVTEYCTADISGSGNIDISVLKALEAIISGSGIISYHGNPVVTSQITGSGKLIKN
jgi:hypothetical protein